jgi:phenylpropionate dioxygenase-like ring-hydroxylating dioxygenase large terminal subunit
MLSKQDNDLLTHVGPGTPMGNLLRRYWTPALLSSEVAEPDSQPVRVRLLGEDLIAFRDTDGKVGLVANACPHRGASLFFGRNEDAGLRCVYHGWKFDATGACVDMPSEPAESNFKNKVRVLAYPTHESGGVIWTYMGPAEKLTAFRNFGTDDLPKDEWRASRTFSSCNWVQSMEGNMDTAHISWLHQYFGILDTPDDGSDRPGYPTNAMSWKFWAHDRAPRLEIDDTWYGYRYAGIRTTPNGHTHVRISAYCIPYTTVVATTPFGTGGGLFVPADDETCWRWNFMTTSMRGLMEDPIFRSGALFGPSQPAGQPYGFFVAANSQQQRSGATQMTRPTGSNTMAEREWRPDNDYMVDRELQRTKLYTGIPNFVSQDMMVTESAGAIWDRSQEHLGTTDRSLIKLRNILLKAAKDLANGIEPPATDPSLSYKSIRSAEKILAPGEDWRVLGTDEDPMVIEKLGLRDAAEVPAAGGASA